MKNILRFEMFYMDSVVVIFVVSFHIIVVVVFWKAKDRVI